MFPPFHYRSEDSSGDRTIRRLLIRPGGIGDCILALPAMEFLKADFTEVWVPSAVVPLIQFADTVQSIAASGLDLLEIDGATALLAKHLQSFDEIVSWYGSTRIEFRTALEALGVPCVFHAALPPLDSHVHAIDFFASQAGAPSGLTPRLRSESEPARGTAVLHPFSGSAQKNWPMTQFRKLADSLARHVEWLTGPVEHLPGAIRIGDLKALAQWLAGAHVYVGNDSGITHLAAAIGVRTVALFGPTDPRVWGPRGISVTVLRHEPIDELTVETVRGLIME